MKKKISRKQFIQNTGLGLAGLLASSCTSSPNQEKTSATNTKKYRWKMVTTWPPNFPVLGESCQLFADWVETMSQGRLRIKIFGGGELVPPLEVFDAVSEGSVEMGNGAAYYWSGKMQASPLFCTVPFGMNAQQMNAWMYGADGIELWRELYRPFNVHPIPAGNTGVQMGGWFNKEINSAADFKGLKMRIPGLGGRVVEKLGAAPVLKPGSELYTSLERGVIDATEWIGPYHDYLMGFHKISKYYYSPGWQEPGATLENMINIEAWNALPPDLQEIVETASARQSIWCLSQFEAKNNMYLEKIKKESDIQIRQFNEEILQVLKKASIEVLDDISKSSPIAEKIVKSYRQFQVNINAWATYSEKEFYQKML